MNRLEHTNTPSGKRHFCWFFGAILCVSLFAVNALAGPPPVITVQPATRTVSLGSSSIFSVSVTSGTTLKYQWYFNGALVTGATNSTYTRTNAQFTNTGPYYVSVANAYGTVNSTNAVLNVLPLTTATLPSPWVTADIGATGLTGSAYSISNVFTVNGAGASMAGVTADQYRYVYQTMLGDGSIVARITSQSGTNVNGNAGIMIRETTAAGSRYMAAVRQGNGVIISRSRASTGGATTSLTGPTLTLPNYWLKLVRTGNNIAASTSTNGSTWVAVQTSSIVMATNITFGLIVTSGNTNVLGSDKFDSITAVP